MSVATEAGGTPVPDDLPDVFGEFCAAGLWPGLGRKLASQLAGAGITGPALVSADRLELIEGVSGERAGWLATAFADARPCYETAQLLAACQVPARFAGPAVAMLGRTAADQLRQDPWRLLALPPDPAGAGGLVRPRSCSREQASPQDERRGRALVSYLLARAARDGHTAVPAAVIAGALGRFRIEDPAAAIAAAVDEGGVLPFEADPARCGGRCGGPGEERTRMRAGPWPRERSRMGRAGRRWTGRRTGRGRPAAGAGPVRHGRGERSRRGCSGWPPWPSRSTARTLARTPRPRRTARPGRRGGPGRMRPGPDAAGGRGGGRGARGVRPDRRPGHRQEPDGGGGGRAGRRRTA